MIELVGVEGCKSATTLDTSDWYQIKDGRGGPDTWLSRMAYICGDMTYANKYIRLCDSCARKEGVKW